MVATFSVTEPVTMIPTVCPLWMIWNSVPAASPPAGMRVGELAQPDADHLVVAHVVPLVEGKRRELDRRDVCPGGPTGQGPGPDPPVRSSTEAGDAVDAYPSRASVTSSTDFGSWLD